MRRKFDGFLIIISGHTFPFNMIPIGNKSIDVILGMYWLLASEAEILCFEKCVCIKLVEGGSIMARGQKSMRFIPIIYVIKERKCLEIGCKVFLAHVIDSPRKTVDLADMEVVRELRDVFPDEFPGLPPPR